MPLYPGRQTMLVVEKNENTAVLDRKGQPTVSELITALPGCKLSPESGAETVGAGTDYSRILWRIVAPPLPAALRIKPSGVIRYADGGALAGKTVRARWTDPAHPELGEQDVAEFNVETSWPHYNGAGALEQVAVVAKSEVG